MTAAVLLRNPSTNHSRMYALQATPAHAKTGAASTSYDAQSENMSRGLSINALLRPDAPELSKFSEFGRTYYRYGNDMYFLPADDIEHERLDIMYHLIHVAALNDQVLVATMRNPPQRVLDVGFGTGFWMTVMASEHPSTEIIGFDLDFAVNGPIAPNCQYRYPVDFNAPSWPIEDCSVDLVHTALLCGCVPNWVDFYRKAYKSLRPGTGQIEHIEMDWTPRTTSSQYLPQTEPLTKWWAYTLQASERTGKSLAYRDDTEELLERAGFVDITHRRIRVPLFTKGNKDPQEMKTAHAYTMAMTYANSQSFFAMSMQLLTKMFNWPPQAAADVCASALAVVQGQPLPLYSTLHVWTARRPQS